MALSPPTPVELVLPPAAVELEVLLVPDVEFSLPPVVGELLLIVDVELSLAITVVLPMPAVVDVELSLLTADVEFSLPPVKELLLTDVVEETPPVVEPVVVDDSDVAADVSFFF